MLFTWLTSIFENKTTKKQMDYDTGFQVSECGISHDGKQYELSSLTLTGDNYKVERGTDTYFINICTTLVHKTGTTCPPNSASCKYSGDEKK